MNDAFVAGVIEVDKKFLPVAWECRRVYRVPMILRSDVASSGRAVSIFIERTNS